jgi:hypothetical protein
MTTTAPWPPPPDLNSLKELFATADIEGLIAEECPSDEYDPEAKHFYEATIGFPTSKFVANRTLPLLEQLWVRQFMLNEEQLAQRRPALVELSQQIARFFGPEAQPQTRESKPI